jgi:2-amino-4-hydroxy-6-hydroxymethyldihydropteridine diphosphokinase
MAVAYLALGSNLGDRQQYIHQAIDFLTHAGCRILKLSSIIETDPVGGPQQGRYLNAVVSVQTLLNVDELFGCIQQIEWRLGRVRSVKNAARTIDIDILTYDDIKLVSQKLMIPHPRMLQRDFVMVPLKEIAPDLCKSFDQSRN